jgi:hypothetical protein
MGNPFSYYTVGFDPKNLAISSTILDSVVSQPGSLFAKLPNTFCTVLKIVLRPKTRAMTIAIRPLLMGAALTGATTGAAVTAGCALTTALAAGTATGEL